MPQRKQVRPTHMISLAEQNYFEVVGCRMIFRRKPPGGRQFRRGKNDVARMDCLPFQELTQAPYILERIVERHWREANHIRLPPVGHHAVRAQVLE